MSWIPRTERKLFGFRVWGFDDFYSVGVEKEVLVVLVTHFDGNHHVVGTGK